MNFNEQPKPLGKSETGNDLNFLDIAEQLEKGTKWGRVPTEEALQVLNSFYQSNSLQLPTLDDSESPENKVISLTEDLAQKLESNPVLVAKAVSALSELNDKYPVADQKV